MPAELKMPSNYFLSAIQCTSATVEDLMGKDVDKFMQVEQQLSAPEIVISPKNDACLLPTYIVAVSSCPNRSINMT